jgi:methionine synthase II (cobalamin-independent)
VFSATRPNLAEHPELVDDCTNTFAELVAGENIVASTDCGLGVPRPPANAWAKLRPLRDGAAIASK